MRAVDSGASLVLQVGLQSLRLRNYSHSLLHRNLFTQTKHYYNPELRYIYLYKHVFNFVNPVINILRKNKLISFCLALQQL